MPVRFAGEVWRTLGLGNPVTRVGQVVKFVNPFSLRNAVIEPAAVQAAEKLLGERAGQTAANYTWGPIIGSFLEGIEAKNTASGELPAHMRR